MLSRSLENISKIGEGVYGEVFQSNKTCVIKVFPIDGNIPVNGEKQMESHRVYSEVFISKYDIFFMLAIAFSYNGCYQL